MWVRDVCPCVDPKFDDKENHRVTNFCLGLFVRSCDSHTRAPCEFCVNRQLGCQPNRPTMIFRFTALFCLLAIASGQAPVLPSYYSRQPYYPTSLYNPSSYPQSGSVNAALAYQQEQQLQRERALSAYQQAYQQSAAAATLPGQPGQPPSYLGGGRPAFTSNPSVNYSPQQLPAVNYQPQTVAAQPAPQSAIQYAQPQYQPQPQTSYNPQGLQTISYQPQNEQPVAPPVTNYDPQPQYNPEEIAGRLSKVKRKL